MLHQISSTLDSVHELIEGNQLSGATWTAQGRTPLYDSELCEKKIGTVEFGANMRFGLFKLLLSMV